MGLCSRIGTLRRIQQNIGEAFVVFPPESCPLGSTGCHIQGCRSGRFLNDPGLLILCGSNAQTGPFCVMDLVINHILIFAVLNQHGEHPVQLPPCLVQNVGTAVIVLRDIHGTVRVGFFGPRDLGNLKLILQEPYGNAAVYHVFSVIPGIIPASGDILGLTALLDRGRIRFVSRCAGQPGCIPGGDILFFNGDA